MPAEEMIDQIARAHAMCGSNPALFDSVVQSILAQWAGHSPSSASLPPAELAGEKGRHGKEKPGSPGAVAAAAAEDFGVLRTSPRRRRGGLQSGSMVMMILTSE